MRKKLTVSLDAEVYEALYAVVGRGNISKFIENLVRPRVIPVDMSELEADYRAMAEEEARLGHALYENEAWEEWKEWYGPNGSLSDDDAEDEQVIRVPGSFNRHSERSEGSKILAISDVSLTGILDSSLRSE